MSANAKLGSQSFNCCVFTLLAVVISCVAGCGSGSRDDYKSDASAIVSPSSAANPVLPPVMVGHPYAFTMIASSDSPATTYTGVVKSVTDEAVVLAQPVEKSNTVPSPSEPKATDASNVGNGEQIKEDVSLKCEQIARLTMVFAPVTK